jgi:hypothetical protein
MKRLASLIVLAGLGWAAAGPLAAHESGTEHVHEGTPGMPAPRNPNLSVANTVIVFEDRIQVQQEQVFQKEFVEVLWNLVDENKDGKLSAGEKKAAPDKLSPNYAGFTSLRVNWFMHLPATVTVQIPDLPSRRPKSFDKTKPVNVRFVAVYPYIPTQMDLVELIIPSVNAHEVTCQFAIETGIEGGRRRLDRIYRTNVGNIVNEIRATGLVQTDGRPPAFSAILSKAPPESQPAAQEPAGGGTPQRR